MLNKKFIMLAIFFVLLLGVSVVSAADNATNDVVNVEEVIDEVVSVEENNQDTIECNNENFNNLDDVEVVSSVKDSDALSFKNDDEVLDASPPYNKYSLSVSDTTIKSGQSGSITISVTSSKGYSYAYDFSLMVLDSNNVMKINQRYYSSSSKSKITHSISANQLSVGTYTIKLINSADSKLMDTAKLTVKSDYPRYSDYSVRISDTTIDYASSGSISMSITPASSSTYKYYYTLEVYDSNNKVKISQSYSGTSAAKSKSYSVNANQLSPGTYTVKIINYADNKVMATSKLTVKSSSIYPACSDYTVKLRNCNCNYGTGADVEFTITPSYSHTYKYYFYLKIYDSNNKEKFSKGMYSKEITSIRAMYISSVKDWNPGTYTMKIINYYDNKVMSTAKLIINKNSDKVTYNSPTKSTVGSVVKKTTPKLITKSKTFKKSVKTKKYTITLKTNKNKAMKKMNVYLKVKGKTYKATTNSKGKATFKIKNLKKKGTFKAKVKYVGNAYYNAVTKTVKIKVK